MKVPEVEWLLALPPREVQLEAMRRSYYGFKLRSSMNDEGNIEIIRPRFQPAVGWGHLAEMRLGKTAMILNEFALFKRDYGVNKLIVLSPNSYKEDWVSECAKYEVPVPALAYQQSKLPKAEQFVQAAKDGFALAVNYEAIYYDQTLDFLGPLIDNKTMIAADESIKLKDPRGLFLKGAMLLAKNAGVRRIATGLPMTQGPHDFYGQGRFIGMFDGKNYYAYRGRYCKMGGFKAKKVVGARNEEELKEVIDQHAFVAKRKDWGHMGDAEYYTLQTPLSAAQQRHYREVDRDFITWLEDGTEVSADQVMGKMMKLQQISSGFVYTEDGRAVEIEDPLKTAKMERLLELLADEVPGKAVVVYHYSKTGDMLMDALAKYKPAMIAGDPRMKARGIDVVSEKARFNHDPSCRVMVLQVTAGKYGHDLSGAGDQRCATMVFFENTYSLDDRTQVEARNTTAFQDWSNVYFDMVSSPVERNAKDALIRKESIVSAVMGSYRRS